MTTSANAPSITEQTVRDLSQHANEPSWLLQRRLDAFRAYEAMAMPDPMDEEWRRTDISDFNLDTESESDGSLSAAFLGDGLPQNVVFTDLSGAARDHEALVKEHLHSLVKPTDWKLSALQAAVWQNGAFLYVPRGVEVEVPLTYEISASGTRVAPHLLIVAEAGSSVTLLQNTYSADAEAQSLICGAVEIIAKQDARVRFVELQGWGKSAYNFSTIRAHLDRGAELTAALVGLGGRLTKTRLEVELAGEGSRAELFGVNFGNANQHFAYVTLQDHVAPRTVSDLLFKAALTDAASEVWMGTVRIQKGGAGSEANQTSRNLLLSGEAKAAPIPVLEIEAYDILRCSHGASAGPLDEEQRFYLESRGIPQAEAERLLIDAFFQQVIDLLPGDHIREHAQRALAAKIGGV
jgi:Fe-S cluster assembly protein SufD